MTPDHLALLTVTGLAKSVGSSALPNAPVVDDSTDRRPAGERLASFRKRLAGLIESGRGLPVDLRGRVIYYVGPVDAVRDEAVGPAGPTTATRMDKFTDLMLEKTGLFAMVGKAERGPLAIEAIRKHGSAYLIAVGGAAYLVSKAIRKARVVAFPELGMEAIYEFEVEDMPVTVAVDSRGESVHETGPREWGQKIRAQKIPVRVA